MKFARTFVISLLFIAAVAIYFVQRGIDQDIKAIMPDEVSRDFSLDANEKIVRIEIINHLEAKNISLDLTDGEWTITAPILAQADKLTAKGFAAALRFASKQTRLRPEKDWGEYGLEKPQLEVFLETDKKKKRTLALGALTPVGKAAYARWTSERGYMLLPLELKEVFESSLYALREKRVFQMPPEKIRKIYIEMGSHTYEWKKDGEKWYWFEPIGKFGKEFPTDRAELVLKILSGLYAKEFMDSNEEPNETLGFYIIHDRIRLEDDAEGEEVLHFGNEVPSRDGYYGMKEKDGIVFLVERGKIYQLLDLLREIENESDAASLKAAIQATDGPRA